MRRRLALGVFLVLTVAPAIARSQDNAADEAALREAAAQYVAAWNASDAARMETFSADDGTIVDEWGVETRGRAAIAKGFADAKALDDLKGAKIAVTVTSVRFIRPDLAVSHGTYTVTGGKMPPDGFRGHYQNIDVKQDGAWKTVSLHLPAVPPPLPQK